MIRRALLLAALAVAACDDGGPEPRFRAAGTLIHSGLADDDRAGWATELEVLRSDRVLGLAAEQLHLETAQRTAVRRGLRAVRRADARVIDVSVAADDRALALAACNAVMRAYTESKLNDRAGAAAATGKTLAAQLDEAEAALRKAEAETHRTGVVDPALPALNQRYTQLLGRVREVELSQPTLTRDIAILDPCSERRSR